MSTRIPEVETSVNLLRSIIWQYDNAESVKSLISQKNEWYKKEQTEFWDNWFRDVFDIRTANDFGLEIWSIILGVSFLVPDCPGKVLTTEQKRLICRLRYYQLIARCTIPEVNEITMKLFATEDGKAYALDPLDMSYIMYVFTEQPTSAVALILAKYDLLPRPATVGLKYRVIRYVPFGFGQYYQNFDNAPFWDGGSLINYAWRINLSFDNNSGLLSGVISSSDSTIDLSGVDVTLFYTNIATGQTLTRDVVTTVGGKFTDTVPDSVRYRVVAKAQIFTPICTTDDVESRPFEFIYIIPGARFVMRIDSPTRPIFYARMDEVFTVDYGDGVDSKDYRFVTDEYSPGMAYGWVIATRPLTVGTDYTITVKRSDTIRFCSNTTLTSGMVFNTLRELITVSGGRADMTYFAKDCTGLYLLHDGVFDYLPNAADFRSSFNGCVSLLTLPEGLFDNCINADSFFQTFRQCTALTLLPSGLFDKCVNATSFRETFNVCSGLISLPPRLFANLKKVGDFQLTFGQCSSLKALPDGLFMGCSANQSFYSTFSSCSNIVTIAPNVFKGNLAALTLYNTFAGATALTAIPDGLFDDCVSALNFEGTFLRCYALKGIPSGLFKNIAGGYFRNTFYQCNGLLSVPDGLFEGLSSANSFYQTFFNCASLKTVGNRVFKGCSTNTDFSYIFTNCAALVSVGLDIFSGCTSATTFSNAFSGCSLLANMPLFTDCNKVTTFASCFQACRSLASITPYAFDGKTLCSTFQYVFYGCSSLTTTPQGVFRGCAAATSFSYAFQNCTGLTSLSGDMFEGCIKTNDVQYMFDGCTSLPSLPVTLLNWFTALQSNTARMFGGCTALTGIPAGFFDKCINLTVLSSSFLSCRNLTTLPAAMFKYNVKLTTVSGMFASCDIRSIPVDTFATCPLMIYFDTFLSENVNFSGIPEDLFVNNPNAISFSNTFYHTNITSVPAGLFRNNTKATNFNNTFYYCFSLATVGAGLFNNTSAQIITGLFGSCRLLESDLNVIFNLPIYPKITSASTAFYNCNLMKGKGLDFIAAVPAVTAPGNKTNAFYQTTSLTDYNQIPAAWGGGGA
ncbi:DUF2612 domain-containing protein [Serratia sp. 14-2641]|uniref:DUF2612 domain-containing protein n=1 Tax=Serratia sp. 14-2641 TaxID=1841657 RepID=UPI00080FF4F4|nr:DUF2612 domain-containing protein [Serratia sp. 14-2641]OCJ20030.1 hypothetical protein A6U95_15320 [Serratia sp. 14-2641]